MEGETYCGSIEMYNPSFEDCANVMFNDNLGPGNQNFGILQIQFLDDAGEVVCFAESDRFDSNCLLYTSPSPRDKRQSRMPSSA